jgi:hypothetical protein
MKKTKVINIISGPGSGKTTLVALLFGKMKILGYDIEMIPEYVKSLVWLKQTEEFNNQYHISLMQYRLLKAYDGVVDYIITDGSLIHGLYYNKANLNNVSDITKTEAAIKKYYSEFENINIYIERQGIEYDTRGRIENKEEAIKADKGLEQIIKDMGIEYLKVEANEEKITEIIEYIKKK